MIHKDEIDTLNDWARGDKNKLNSYIKRRKSCEPLAYILGEVEFCNLKFYVDRRAYIPNPETQMLVECALDYLRQKQIISPILIDVGTGSGNIAICLAKEFPEAMVYGTDILPDSLVLAKKNAQRHNCEQIKFIETDLISAVSCPYPDLIIADLPYGSPEYILKTNDLKELQHMPVIACFPEGIFNTYKELTQQIIDKRWKTVLLFESGIVPENIVRESIPRGLKWSYIKLDDKYSITQVHFL